MKINFFEKIIFGKNAGSEISATHHLADSDIWDPVTKINVTEVDSHCDKLEWKKRQLVKHPKKNGLIILFSFILGLSCLFFLSYDFIVLLGPYGLEFDLYLGIFFIIIGFVYYAALNKVKIDLIKYEIANRNNWLYDPDFDVSKAKKLLGNFPEVLNVGNSGQIDVEDQFWGTKVVGGVKKLFYSGLYRYGVESINSKGRRTAALYYQYFFIIKLDKKLRSNFLLYPESFFSKIGNVFTKKEINVESVEFNKTFAFKYNGKKDERAMDVVGSLSPRVQEKLVDLSRANKGISVLFKNDSVMFVLNRHLLNKFKSKILFGLKIDQRDVDLFKKNIDHFVDISADVSKYLD